MCWQKKIIHLLEEILEEIRKGNQQNMANQNDLIAEIQSLQAASAAETTAVMDTLSGLARDISTLDTLVANLVAQGSAGSDQTQTIADIQAVVSQLNTNAQNASAALNSVNAAKIVLTPADGFSLSAGATQQFTAQVLDGAGNDITAQSTVAWTASGGPITSAGLFGPYDAAGALSVTATVGSVTSSVSGTGV